MLSARAGEEARVEGLAAGADDYLVKPFSARDLLARVNAQLVRSRIQAFEQQQAARLNSLLIDLAKARDAAEASNRLKDEFLATLSHELRTPLNAILGWTQHAARRRRRRPRRRPRALETIERNARLQAQLVEDLLDVSRIITGKLRLERAAGRPGARSSHDAIETVRPAADAKGVRDRRRPLDQRARRRPATRERLQQVVWNLLSNAVKFTPRGGRVQVRVARRSRTSS